jgi:hypothetical protein
MFQIKPNFRIILEFHVKKSLSYEKMFQLKSTAQNRPAHFQPDATVPKATTIETEDLRVTVLVRYLKAGDIGGHS